MQDLKQRFDSLSTKFKVLIVAGGLLLAAPFAAAAFMGTVTLVMLLLAGTIASTAIAFAPVWAMKLANWKLKSVKAEATRNPIETRQNIYIERVQKLHEFAAQIERFTAKLGAFQTQLTQLRKDYPDEVAPFERTFQAMVKLKAAREQEYLNAKKMLENYKRETEKAQRIWDMALSARALGESAGMELDPMKEIAEKTALEAVEVEMNASFAQLDRLMLERVAEPVGLPGVGKPILLTKEQAGFEAVTSRHSSNTKVL